VAGNERKKPFLAAAGPARNDPERAETALEDENVDGRVIISPRPNRPHHSRSSAGGAKEFSPHWGGRKCALAKAYNFGMNIPFELSMLVIPLGAWPAIACSLCFGVLFALFFQANRGGASFYFDPQDFVHYENGQGRELPLSAENSTFEPHLKNYLDVIRLLVTVAAASIAFGGTQHEKGGIIVAKIILSFSILYGVVFSGLLQFLYDEYGQNVRAYTRLWYSLIETLGFSALACFIAGFLVWAFNLG
jgi:hypothetical protein